MRPEDISNALSMIGHDLYDEKNLKPKKTKHIKIKWTAVIAAVLSVSIALTFILIPAERSKQKENEPLYTPDDSNVYLYNGTLAAAIYPKSPVNPSVSDESNPNADEWYQFYKEMDAEFEELGIDLNEFYKATSKTIFKEGENENRLYSPLSLYMALAMTAEICGGESRAQLLELADCDTIDELRRNARAVWKACYKDDGLSSVILANSLWLDNNTSYNQETLETLAEYYYASSFEGEAGSKEFNETLRSWINDQTHGLLGDYVKDIEIAPDAVINLVSTLYFNAEWTKEFDSALTENAKFYSVNGEQSCEFMNSSDIGNFFTAESFTATKKELTEAGSMYLILPDEGFTPEEIMAGDELYRLISEGDMWQERRRAIIDLSLPKFDVSSKLELKDPLCELGITDIFDDSKANFENLTDTNGSAGRIEHSVRVSINEEGCEAAAYTIIAVDGATSDPDEIIEFTLDRPFIFIITSDAGIPLYSGIVNQI